PQPPPAHRREAPEPGDAGTRGRHAQRLDRTGERRVVRRLEARDRRTVADVQLRVRLVAADQVARNAQRTRRIDRALVDDPPTARPLPEDVEAVPPVGGATRAQMLAVGERVPDPRVTAVSRDPNVEPEAAGRGVA